MFKPPRQVQRKRLDDRYEVGNDGVVYSDGCALVPINGVGVNIHGRRMKIAYLVARAWVGNQEGRPYVRHINGNVKDNRPENLEWCEEKEVTRKGRKAETRWCSCFDLEGNKVGMYRCPSDGAVDKGVDVRFIRKCLAGRQKSAGGYIWRWGC